MSEQIQILPVLDTLVLQEKATEYAMKGAVESIKEFYSGWNSPFRKQIDEELSKKEIGTGINLPDIIALINESLSKEIDMIANTAVSKSFIPMVQNFLIREEKEIKFSDILKRFIEVTESKDQDECEVNVEESRHGWLNVDITTEDRTYSITLHTFYSDDDKGKYQLLSLPNDLKSGSHYNRTMTLQIDGAKLEMPFTRDVLSDPFNAYIAKLVVGGCKITMDCNDFSEDMWPEDHCRC